jgi:beta-galactosidase
MIGGKQEIIMQKILFNDGWKFKKLPIEKKDEIVETAGEGWLDVPLPHDWLIYDSHKLYESSVGWYTKQFTVDKESKRIFICFDGIYFNSTVFVNGSKAGTWRNGYTEFTFDITDFLTAGENTITVQVVHESPNSRWYSGAGIYRNVWLKTANLLHVADNGVYINTDGKGGNVKIHTEIMNHNKIDCNVTVKQIISLTSNKKIAAEITNDGITIPAGETHNLEQSAKIDNPILWELDAPQMYQLVTEIYYDGKLVDETTTPFGFRSFAFDVNEGFFLYY